MRTRTPGRSARVPAQTPLASPRASHLLPPRSALRRCQHPRRALRRACPARRSGFRSVDREQDPETAVRALKELGGKMTECKRCAPCARCCKCADPRRPAALRAAALRRGCGRRVGAEARVCACAAPRSLIREFEKEARSDGMDANQVQRKKTVRAGGARRRGCAQRARRCGGERSAALNARRGRCVAR